MTEFILIYYVLCGCLMTTITYAAKEINFMNGFKRCKAISKGALAGYLCLVIISWPAWAIKGIIIGFIEIIR